jgi:hypothetical protein
MFNVSVIVTVVFIIVFRREAIVTIDGVSKSTDYFDMFVKRIFYVLVQMMLLVILVAGQSFAQVNSNRFTFEQILNMEDDDKILKTTSSELHPPLLWYNDYVMELRNIGPIKKRPVTNSNVKLFTTSKDIYQRYSTSCIEIQNRFDGELMKVSLDYVKETFGNDLFSRGERDLSQPISTSPQIPGKIELIPIAHAIKVFGQSTTTIPNLLFESIVQMNIALPVNKNNSTHKNIFILVCCKYDTKYNNQLQLSLTQTYEYVNKDCVSFNAPDLTAKLPDRVVVRKNNLMIFKHTPSHKQIKEFILSTDFGNNNIYPYTDFATLFDYKVITVSVNKNYKQLLPIFKIGLTGNDLKERVKVYNRALVGITATVHVGSN